jgi:thioredoxin 1
MRRSLLPALCALLLCASVVRAFDDPACPACQACEAGEYLGRLAQQAAGVLCRFGWCGEDTAGQTRPSAYYLRDDIQYFPSGHGTSLLIGQGINLPRQTTYEPIDPSRIDAPQSVSGPLHVFDPLAGLRTPPQPLHQVNTGWRPRMHAAVPPKYADPHAPLVLQVAGEEIRLSPGQFEAALSGPDSETFTFFIGIKRDPGEECPDATSRPQALRVPYTNHIGPDGLERIGIDFECARCAKDTCPAEGCAEGDHCPVTKPAAGVPILTKIPYLNRLFKNTHGGVVGSVEACGACSEKSSCASCQACCESCACDGDCCADACSGTVDHLERAAVHLEAAGLKDEATATRLKALQIQIDHLKSLVSQQAEQTQILKRENAELRERFARLEQGEKTHAAIEGSERMILGFIADWCGPCQEMLPAVARLRNGGLPIRIIDVDTHKDLAEKFGVTSIPTFIILQNGEVLQKSVGAVSEFKLRQIIDDAQPTADPDVVPTSGEAETSEPRKLELHEDIQSIPQPVGGEALSKWDGLTNVDVAHWLELGVNEEAIIDAIRQHRTKFSLSPEAIEKLKSAGATDALVQHMRKGKLRELIGH